MTISKSDVTVLPSAMRRNRRVARWARKKLHGQVDECCLAPRVLHWPFKDNVVGDKVLPFVPMRIERCVISIHEVSCVCVHARIDQRLRRPPSVVPAEQHLLARSATTAREKLPF
jgi:hypothetical protein